ncbi:MAG: glutaredoxin 3 [Sphingomonadales bacterium]|nr:glutaredoxin 3 [Sphingomonadales bacterium]
MTKVEIYTKLMCPYCARAKALLEQKGVAYREIDVGINPDLRAEMVARANGRNTVPQIFINDAHIGGCDDIHALDAAGGLDPLLRP